MVAERLSSRRYLVGDQFTAADLTLAALLRPTRVVPYFYTHPHLQRLFEWREMQVKEHRREALLGYELALQEVRRRRGWALGEVSWLPAGSRGAHQPIPAEIPHLPAARNDQRSVGRWPLITGLLTYRKLARTCGLERTVYSE
jgi:glutathione S-transferase